MYVLPMAIITQKRGKKYSSEKQMYGFIHETNCKTKSISLRKHHNRRDNKTYTYSEVTSNLIKFGKIN